MSLNVGLNIVETDGRATPSIQPAPTSVAAFLIRSERGVENVVRRLTNWRQFNEHFGGYQANANGAYAIRGFFDNGGSIAYVTRLFETDEEMAQAAYLRSEQGPFALSMEANRLTLRVDGDSHTVTFSQNAPAQLTGGSGPYNLASAPQISLHVTGEQDREYVFIADDFEILRKRLRKKRSL